MRKILSACFAMVCTLAFAQTITRTLSLSTANIDPDRIIVTFDNDGGCTFTAQGEEQWDAGAGQPFDSVNISGGPFAFNGARCGVTRTAAVTALAKNRFDAGTP